MKLGMAVKTKTNALFQFGDQLPAGACTSTQSVDFVFLDRRVQVMCGEAHFICLTTIFASGFPKLAKYLASPTFGSHINRVNILGTTEHL